MRAKEFQPKKLVIFDIDDTLVHTQTKVHIVKDGQVTKELNSHEFTHYKLQPGEQFDFENFRNAHDFFHKSKPIIPMMNQLKQDIATGNKVVMVTARADFDDKELFLDTFRKYGVNMAKVHVYRAGNMTGKIQTEEKKKIIIRNLLDKDIYTKAIMYDDAVPNLESFVELKKEYPNTKFYAWHVSLEGEASEYQRTDENFADGKHPEDKGDAKRHGINTKASVSSLRKTAKQGGRKGQLAHWLANMKAGRAKHESIESADPKKEKLIHDFLKFATKKLQLRSDFTIEFSYDTKSAQDEHHTGAYNFKKNHMTVYSAHRNLIDILRTLCHELVHAKQDQLGQLHHHDAPGSPHEAQADEIAGYLIKLYVKKHHDIIQ